jgi:hypothetical protein
VDLTGVSPLVGLGVRDFTVGPVALKASCKMTKHVLTIKHIFIPFAFTTFGFLAIEAVNLLKEFKRS